MKCLLEELISQEAENKKCKHPSATPPPPPPPPIATPISDIKSKEMSLESIVNNV